MTIRHETKAFNSLLNFNKDTDYLTANLDISKKGKKGVLSRFFWSLFCYDVDLDKKRVVKKINFVFESKSFQTRLKDLAKTSEGRDQLKQLGKNLKSLKKSFTNTKGANPLGPRTLTAVLGIIKEKRFEADGKLAEKAHNKVKNKILKMKNTILGDDLTNFHRWLKDNPTGNQFEYERSISNPNNTSGGKRKKIESKEGSSAAQINRFEQERLKQDLVKQNLDAFSPLRKFTPDENASSLTHPESDDDSDPIQKRLDELFNRQSPTQTQGEKLQSQECKFPKEQIQAAQVKDLNKLNQELENEEIKAKIEYVNMKRIWTETLNTSAEKFLGHLDKQLDRASEAKNKQQIATNLNAFFNERDVQAILENKSVGELHNIKEKLKSLQADLKDVHKHIFSEDPNASYKPIKLAASITVCDHINYLPTKIKTLDEGNAHLKEVVKRTTERNRQLNTREKNILQQVIDLLPSESGLNKLGSTANGRGLLKELESSLNDLIAKSPAEMKKQITTALNQINKAITTGFRREFNQIMGKPVSNEKKEALKKLSNDFKTYPEDFQKTNQTFGENIETEWENVTEELLQHHYARLGVTHTDNHRFANQRG
jgi:hypothetical protein